MSIKKYFEVTENIKSLSQKSANAIATKVESTGHHQQDIIAEERFIPRVNYNDPANFARYGSAEEYYAQSIKRIYSTYPYDGSLQESLQWLNNSTYLDLHLFENDYPRTNGYVILSAEGWGSSVGSVDGYGTPENEEYIFFAGGPNANPHGSTPFTTQFSGSNVYEPSMNRESNLQLDIASRGASVEFWLKKDEFITGLTEKEVIFDAWNGEPSSSADYGRLRVEISGTADGLNPVYVTLYSGSTGFTERVASPTFTTSSLADGNWHHYAVTLLAQSSTVLTRFYVDGQLDHQRAIGLTMGDINSSDLRANIGALVASPSGSSAPSSAGKLSGSLDEFRYWKTHRSSEDIGLFWFSQVGGGVNTDPTPFVDTKETANIDLGVYYKFNEGITGVRATDATVLDYAGRLTNGAWTGYTGTSRNTGSAIVLSHAAIKEFKDPIIYSFHPAVKALESRMAQSGSAYDAGNNAAIYNSIPSWITEEDTEGEGELRKLTQIISSYFDTLQLQVESLNNLKDIEYVSGSNKPLPFAEKLLASNGLVAPELFIDADILEKLNDRSEDKLYEKSLEDIKNTIYQNIYNNLSYIYKSKGTAKSFRNLIRCFGIGEELVRINMYADNVEYELRNNRTEVITADKFVNFNTERNQYATVYNYPDPSNANAVGFVTSSTALTAGYALTLESEVVLPLKPDQAAEYYFDTNAISSSVFGVHGATDNPIDTVWNADDSVNFQVYTVRDELQSNNARFVLTSSTGGHIPLLSSELLEDIYNNTRWNLAVRIKPEKYPLENFVSGADSGNYIVELHGCQTEAGEILQEFTVSGTITSPPDAFITGSRRVYVGAHRTNMTGGLLQTSDVKVNSCRYWLDYVEDEALRGHVLDTENFGAMQPHLYAYQFDPDATFGDITKMDTLVFNWEFLTNTGSNASGEFSVADISSGSQALTRFGQLGDILNKQYTAAGSNFEASSTSAIDKDFIVSSKLNLPEHIYSEDMVSVLNQQDQDVFVPDSRPIHYYFAFEKSMYQAISVEMLNYFANLKDLNNLIGDAVNQWRPEYKSLAFVRQKFFEKVSNSQLDFDKFYEFYKWFDSSLSVMLGQLVPASADFASNVRTVIESHILERSKYQRKFPFIVKEGALNIGGTEDSMPEWDSYQAPLMAPPPGPGGMQSAMHPTRRQIGTPAVVPQFSWDKVHPPVDGNENKNLYWQRYLNKDVENADAINDIHKAIRQTYMRRIGSPVNLGVEGNVVLGGVGKHPGTRPGYTFAATAPWGPVVPLTNIPTNVMLSFDTDVEELIDTPDVFNPSLKQRLGFGMDPSINIDGNRKGNGNTFAPFSLYSSSITTGYNEPVQRLYKSGTMVTNLHNDFVGNTDIPMQGPFTEKYVGGRQYRHTPLNDGTDTRENRAEGFRVELGLLDTGSAIPVPASGSLGVVPPNYPFGDSPSGSAPHGFLPNIPIAPRLREEAAKRPVNIKNIQLRTGSTIIGNYEKNYQVVNTAGRIYNDPYFNDQSFDFSLFPETTATRGRFPLTASTENVGGNRNYELPDRSGANSNQTVIVNRFSAPGSYEVMSRGYMDPAHEELSVYNATPYRNRGVISYGLSGSASVDPVAARTITVVDQIEKNRGLDQRASLHCGPFGSDAAYGSVPALTYVTVPSWNKTNRNARKLMKSGSAPSTFVTGVVYDNLFVQHQIPRSEQQYSWISASLAEGETIFGLQGPSCFSASALTQIVSSSIGQDSDGNPIILNFVGINEYVYEPLSASSHILGYPLGTDLLDYRNTTLLPAGIAHTFNVLQLHRNGPYGYPTWKQIRTGEHPIARELRKTNMIGQVVPPKSIPNIVGNKVIGYISPQQPNTFVDYFEAPIMSQYSPVSFYLEDNTSHSNTANNVILSVPYGNELDWFNHDGLNNRLGLKIDLNELKSYNSILRYILAGKGSSLSMMANHSQRIYPAAVNVYNDIVRARTEFTIDNIWNIDRDQRSELGSEKLNSQGVEVLSASIWPLDAHLNFTTTSSVTSQDGSGELMNSYSRYLLPPEGGGPSRIFPAATYASRIACGTTGAASEVVFAGDTEWLAASQSGKQPYQDYRDYADHMRLVGKDHSIVPEFRISSHIETYIEDNEGDFLMDIDGIFELTGAAHPNSLDSNFFKVYTNSDFMKYFKAIDEDLNNKRSGNLRIRREKVSLKCDALVKFLPYKGFYPADRTTELATLFSQSYAPSLRRKTNGSTAAETAIYRALLEPLYAPGIMYNTVKSGIAVSNFVMANTSSATAFIPSTSSLPTLLPEGRIAYKNSMLLTTDFDVDDGYYLQKIPFEALYRPPAYFNTDYIAGNGSIYDTGVGFSGAVVDGIDPPGSEQASVVFNNGKKLYELAIDNFLCETLDFFNDNMVDFSSKREDQFAPVVSGSEYSMQLKLYRTMNANLETDRTAFEMYTRISAFGAPVVSTSDLVPGSASFSHITPPYISGSGTATFTFTAPTTGIASLDTILANTTITFDRDEVVPGPTPADYDPKMQVDSCFNLTGYYDSVPPGTVGSLKTWLIQSKFETPVLNFAGVATSSPPVTTVSASLTPASEIATTGMWHQYGVIPSSTTNGIFAVIDPGQELDGTTQLESLADIVGFPSGRPLRVGSIKKENLLEEAVIVVPFKVTRNRRKFFKARQRTNRNGTNTQFLRIKALMDKYVFPPKFDFTRHRTVDPILMYAFEFSAKLSQQDIADMWQNLPPSIGEKFEQKEVIIEEKEILNLLADNSEDIQWMVFKVKKRAKKNYEKYRRSLVTEDTSAFPDTIGEYSYNWPYDYFSLVELIKIEEGVQYSSSDMGQVIDVSPEVVADLAPRRRDEPPPALDIPAGRDG